MARSGGVGVTGGVSAGTSETVSVSELVLAGLFLSSFWSAGRFWGSIRLVGTFIVVVLGLAEVAAGAALVSSPLVGLGDVAGEQHQWWQLEQEWSMKRLNLELHC